VSQSLDVLDKIPSGRVRHVRSAPVPRRPLYRFRFFLAAAGSLLMPALLVVSLLAQGVGAGSLDPDFGLDGVVTTDFGGTDEATALAVQVDDKIVAAGMTYVGDKIDFAIARYNPDGSLDESFGEGGLVRTGLGAAERATAVALQADGKLVVAGWSSPYPSSTWALARYDSTGQLDPSFGDGGIVLAGFGGADYANDLAIQPDGRIVVAGDSCAESTCSIALARFNTNGSLDESFGMEGRVTTLVGQMSGADGVVLQADGKIVVAGRARLEGIETVVVAVVRYQANGNLDPGFGEGGVTTTDFGGAYDHAYAVLVQRDGKLVVAGSAGTLPNTDFMLSRYNADGTLDPAFGKGGTVTTDLAGYEDRAHALMQQPNGALVVAGVGGPTSSARACALARYTPAGDLDASFGTGGLTLTEVAVPGYFYAAALQRDGRIVVAGYDGVDFALARYLNDTPGVFRVWLPMVTK